MRVRFAKLVLACYKQSRLAQAVRIFVKCEFVSENAKTNLRSFATFTKTHFSIDYMLYFQLRKIV